MLDSPPGPSTKTTPSFIARIDSFRSAVDGLISTVGSTRGAIEAILTLVGSIIYKLSPLKELPTGYLIIGGCILCVGAIFVGRFIRNFIRRSKIQPVNAFCFVGSQPLDQSDRDSRGFFGRDSEIEDIANKLHSSSVRYLILHGESGSGKTSLLKAGILPELRLRNKYHPVYVCLNDQPVSQIREAFRAESNENPQSAEQRSLIEELEAARRTVEKPLLLFVDQFEGLQLNAVAPEDYRQIKDLISRLINNNSGKFDSKVILSLRSDFLQDLLDIIYDDENCKGNLAQGEARVRIKLFSIPQAEEVLRRTLAHRDILKNWDDKLINRIISDLAISQRTPGQNSQVIRPTELQIVCQMVQTKHIVSAAKYPGKSKLLLEYIADAINTAPGSEPNQVRQILLQLIDKNGITKSKPQTIQELAGKLNLKEKETPRLKNVLDYLDKERRLVRSYKLNSNETDFNIVYELAHDYVVSLISIVANAEINETRFSEVMLQTARLQSEYNKNFRFSIKDWWHLRRYPADNMTNEDRSLMQRSLRSFILRFCAPAFALCLTWMFLRCATVHPAIKNGEIVFQQGLPFASPLLGSDETVLAIGVGEGLGFSGDPSIQRLFRVLEQKPSMVHLSLSASAKLNVDRWLRWQFTATFLNYLRIRRNNIKLLDPSEADAVYMINALDLNAEAADYFDERMLRAFDLLKQQCQNLNHIYNRECVNRQVLIYSLASYIHSLNIKKPNTVELFRKNIREASPTTMVFQTSFIALSNLHELDQETRSRILTLITDNDPTVVAFTIQLLWRAQLIPQRKIEDFLSLDVRKHAANILWNSTQKKPVLDERLLSVWMGGLVLLGLPNDDMVNSLYDKVNPAQRASIEEATRALLRLLDLGIREQRLIGLLNDTFANAMKAMSQVDRPDCEPSRIETARDLNLAFNIIASLGDSEVLNEKPLVFRETMREFLTVYMRRAHDYGIQYLVHLIKIARRLGIPMKEILQILENSTGTIHEENANSFIWLVDSSILNIKNEEKQRLLADKSLEARLRTAVAAHIDSDRGNEGCIWARIALNYRIMHPAIERRASDPNCFRQFEDAYARQRLLAHTEGFDQALRLAAETSADVQYQPESLDHAINRLLDIFLGSKTMSSSTYRNIVAYSLKLAVEKLRESDPRQAALLAVRLRALKETPSTPLALRLALVDVIDVAANGPAW